jgi:multicomponent Na+:H+ antiporter subunit C
MTIVTLTVVAVLAGIGTYLILQRQLTRIIIGLALLSHAVNVLLLSSGARGEPPVIGEAVSGSLLADPLPQALVLTAIVITFGVTAFLLALALRSTALTGSDAVEDDLEDRRIARQLRKEEPAQDDESMHEELSES